MELLTSGSALWHDRFSGTRLSTRPLLQTDIAEGNFSSLTVEHASQPAVEWVDKVAEVARSGYPQIILLAAVSAWVVAGTIVQIRSPSLKPAAKSSKIPLPYEICSQISRAAALAFTFLNAHQTTVQWLNVALLTLSFVLGLLRLGNDLGRRHHLLHQVNVLLVGTFFIMIAAELLPMLVITHGRGMSRLLLGSLVSLTTAVAIALRTPREWMPPDFTAPHFRLTTEPKPAPEETCSWLDYFATYGWLTSTIWKGCKKTQTLELNDLPSLPWYDEPLLLLSRIEEARKRHRTTLRTVLAFGKWELFKMAVCQVIHNTSIMVAPFGLYQLLGYLSDPEGATLHPALWLFLMFISPVIRSVSQEQYLFTSTRLIVRVKAALVQELYGRAMSSMELEDDVINSIVTNGKPEEGQRSTSAGRLANLMSSDIDAILGARDVIWLAIGTPVGIALSAFGLYKVIGLWPSLSGIALLLTAGPAGASFTQKMASSQRQVKQAQDSRISVVSELLGSIKAIKSFGWEDAMASHVQEARSKEQKYLWRLDLWNTLMTVVTDIIPLIALVTMFGLYAGVLKRPLTAQIAFVALTLVMNIRENFSIVAYLARKVSSALISVERLDRFFHSTVPLTKYPVGSAVTIRSATFRRNKTATFKLEDISLEFIQGGLNVVTGTSGSGKTSLLLAILGETILEKGSVTRPEDLAFVSQTSWLQSETIRDNILFNSPFEQARYDRVLEACCLGPDLKELPDGDQTEVGENGTALSGGQKSRVALARALYSKAPLLLLDDIFSALDTKTAASVWKLCFCSDMLRGRTTVLVTQMPWVATQADLSIVLENGTVKSVDQHLGVIRKPVTTEEAMEQLEEETQDGDKKTNGATAADKNLPKPATDAKAKQDALVAEETKASGGNSRLLFFQYMLAFGGPGYAFFALFMTVLSNVVIIATQYWLSIWVDAYESQDEALSIVFYLGIYTAFTTASCILESAEMLTYMNGQWIAGRNLHRKLVASVMNVSLHWWKNVPVGRVVNRFSRDMDTLDTVIAHHLRYAIWNAIGLLFRIGAISSIMPIFMLPGLFACVVGIIFGEMYTRTAVIAKRLMSSSQSPVFSQFSESMMGLPVIRARNNMPMIFGDQLAERLRSFSRTQEASWNCNRWVDVRIDFVTALVSLLAGIIAVSKAGTLAAGLVGFSLISATGLSDSILTMVRAANELEVQLQSFHRVDEYVQLEPEEKTDDVRNEPAGAYHDIPETASDNWPATGSIEFRNVTIRYEEDGPDILKDVNLTFQAGERVAVVGRTGSGKSTLVLSLLHFTHIVSGQILYDGVDITMLPRKKLRQAITIIPQEAVLFNGTVKSNLDPAGDASDDTLEAAISSCGKIASFQFHDRGSETNTLAEEPVIATSSSSMTATEVTPLLTAANDVPSNGATTPTKASTASSLSLSTPVLPKGENFSHGQRQVLSLCRALVRKSKLMLLDEATASMDYETDRGIQTVLRKEMGMLSDTATSQEASKRTLVTVAHRLRTIADYDKVVVMSAGRVAEVGAPKELFKAGGIFAEMVRFSGEGEDLVRLMAE